MRNKKFKWAYLGENILNAKFIEEKLGHQAEKIEIAEHFHKISRQLRNSYIEYVGELNRQINKLEWWATRIAERNPAVSKTFINLCFLKLALDIVKKYAYEPIVLFVDDYSLQDAIYENLGVPRRQRVYRFIERLRNYRKKIIEKAWFILKNTYRMILSSYAYPMRQKIKLTRPLTLIHSWVDIRSFKGKKYNDSYFKDLPDYLAKKKIPFAIVPSVMSVPYKKVLKHMYESKYNFLPLHACIKFSDILRAACVSPPNHGDFPKFEGLIVDSIFQRELMEDRISNRYCSDILFYYFIKRLKQMRVEIDVWINTYENHSWEKVVCLALRQFYPEAIVIGYQHAVFSKMFTNYFFSRKEIGLIPLPDRIITSGSYFKKLLRDSGYPPEILADGGAIRYKHVLIALKKRPSRKSGNPTILVTPTTLPSAVELTYKVYQAFKDQPTYRIIFKYHPLVPFTYVKPYIDFRFPSNFEISTRPVPELLKRAHILLYTSSGASLEALSMGVPVIHVVSDFMIDLDPLGDYPQITNPARTPKEIAKNVNGLLKKYKKLCQRRHAWKKILRKLLNEPSVSTYEQFLKFPIDKDKIKINGARIFLRTLKVEDVTKSYLQWLNDPEVTKFLQTKSITFEKLRKYVREKYMKNDALLLGIFLKKNRRHLGNIKLEPIDFKEGKGCIGIMIGEKKYWGKGIGPEALKIFTKWAFEHLNLRKIWLGVSVENKRAIKAYKKAGFSITKRLTGRPGSIIMEIRRKHK